MARSPFYPFRNSSLTFEVEDTGTDILDSSGNPQPRKRLVTILCFLKPDNVRSDSKVDEKYAGASFSEVLLQGYVVDPEVNPLAGINVLDKTVSATYQGQAGVFMRTARLSDPVGAFNITGVPISGTFRVIGGQ